MAEFRPQYRYTVFAPRSEDVTEATIMTPVAGAPHSDQFMVSTHPMAGFQPYMEAPPWGRRGVLNVLEARSTVGRITLFNLDKRLDTINTERWFTAFTGNAAGRDRLRGARCVIEESLDEGATWADFYTGRIYGWDIQNALKFTLTLQDITEDLNRRIFVGRPATDVSSYAALPWVVPLGLEQSFGNHPATARLDASYSTQAGARRVIQINPGPTANRGNIVPKILTDGADSESNIFGVSSWVLSGDQIRLAYVGGVTGEFEVESVRLVSTPDGHRRVHQITVLELDSGDPNFIAFPGSPESATVGLRYIGPPKEKAPLFIDDIHPFQLMEDIFLGYFGSLDVNGDPLWTNTIDTAEFTSFISDVSWGTVRFAIKEETTALDFLEEFLGEVKGAGFRILADGSISPLDLRPVTDNPSLPVILDAHLDETADSPFWELGGNPITTVRTEWILESFRTLAEVRAMDERDPDITLGRHRESENIVDVVAIAPVIDIGDERFSIKAHGLRAKRTEVRFGTIAFTRIGREIEQRAIDLFLQFQSGEKIAVLNCRRVAGITSDCFPGDYREVLVSQLPDPSTHRRGGQRLMLCISREEMGPRLQLVFQDSGLNLVALTPSITGWILTVGDEQHSIDAEITENADDDTVEVWYAVTDTTVGTRPVEGSDLWTFSHIVSFPPAGPTTRSIAKFSGGITPRIWGRARAKPFPAGRRQPSAWVFPTAPGYVDLSALPVPTTLTETPGGVFVTLNWVNPAGTTALSPQVLLAPLATPLDDSTIIAVLPARTTRFDVGELTQSTNYHWTVRYVDETLGTVGASASAENFTTTAATNQAPNTGVPVIVVGRDTTYKTDAISPTIGTFIRVVPADLTIKVEVEFTIDDGGGDPDPSAILQFDILQPGVVTFEHHLPGDGVLRFYRTRHIGGGYTDGAFSNWSLGATPNVLDFDELANLPPESGQGGVSTVSPERIIAPVGTDLWAT